MGRRVVAATFACLFLGALAGCAAGDSPTSRPPISTAHASPAQPTPSVQQIQQGDPCRVNGATAVNQQGKAFDCEPAADGMLRWIIP